MIEKVLEIVARALSVVIMLMGLIGLFMLMSIGADAKAEPKPVTGFQEDSEEYWDALEELALITLAEAGNQSVYGKQLVIDVILNRVQSDEFPDTIPEVIEQPGQFAAYSNGAIWRQELSPEICALVLAEINDQADTEVLFFQCGGYHRTPVVKEGAHYFSK